MVTNTKAPSPVERKKYLQQKRCNVYSKKYRWLEKVEKFDLEMQKHILPKQIAEVILPVEELIRWAQRAKKLGERGENLYDEGVKWEVNQDWRQEMIGICARLEYHNHVLRDISEALYRGPVPMFPAYDCKFVSREPVESAEEKIYRMFRKGEEQ